VAHLLANRGALPSYQLDDGSGEMSPRKRGVRQGGALILAGAVLVPLLAVLNAYTPLPLEIFVALAAVICFIGGPLRMLYAAIFEEGGSLRRQIGPSSYAPPASMPAQLGTPVRGSALPPSRANPASGWRPRPNTAEILQPPSVTENTTRLLDEDERRSNN
jgi:hypothetical protein